MRNPNGYGGIKKLSGKRRRPYAVFITTGWEMKDGKAKQIQKALGYYATRQDAMIALAEYNRQPFDLDSRDITFGQIYEQLKKEKFDLMKPSARRSYLNSFAKCDSIKDMRMIDIKKHHMQRILDFYADMSRPTLSNIVNLFHAVFRYAMENDLIEKDYSQFVTIKSNATPREKNPLTLEEITILWKNAEKKNIDALIILVYTGLRYSELIGLKTEDVHLNERILDVKGTKTKAAKRIVPIHEKLIPLFEKRLKTDELFNISHYDFRQAFQSVSIEHTTHECRHTFLSLATSYSLNPLLIKKIVGHSTQDLTFDVYTHAYIDDLIKEIDKIKA